MTLLTTLYLALVSSTPVLATLRCGQRTHPSLLLARSTEDDLTNTGINASGLAPIVVDTYMHAVASNSTALTSKEAMDRQLQVLNQDFGPANISFTLRNTTWTENQDWTTGANGVYAAMMATLNQGGIDALNLYFVEVVALVGFPPPYEGDSGELLGVASLPWDASTDDPTSNACLVDAGSVPGGYKTPTNLGRTATHEVGHWFGLYHPFEGGCVADPNGGDRVSDTPAAANATFDCDVGRDSCPDLPGLDPVKNYMGASDDDCLNNFTPGQIVRMHAAWNKWRSPQSTTTTTATTTPSPTASPSSSGQLSSAPLQLGYALVAFSALVGLV